MNWRRSPRRSARPSRIAGNCTGDDIGFDRAGTCAGSGESTTPPTSIRNFSARAARTRYHGDLHLGQVLIAQDDFVIIDFEGDPRRPIGSWRGKHCSMRDVAGLLYSMRKAAHVARGRIADDSPERDAAAELALARWEREASTALQLGYRDASAGLASMPSEDAPWRALLNLFLLERTLYELQYELDRRYDPALPLRSLLRFVTG